ncbi:MAG TPA: hypothetical protein VFZ34_15890 [Blastocatellia bacterium]|nr:hypothetical protein [Blastocatellia bacterium]
MHLSTYQIQRYRLAQLAPAELLAVDDHITQCQWCQHQMQAGFDVHAALRRLQTSLHWTPGDEHLAPHQFAAYVNNQLNTVERELIVSHLDICTGCAAQLQFVRQAPEQESTSIVAACLAFLHERFTVVCTIPLMAAVILLLVTLADWFFGAP